MMITGEIPAGSFRYMLNACDKVGGDYIAQLIAVHFQFTQLSITISRGLKRRRSVANALSTNSSKISSAFLTKALNKYFRWIYM